MARPISYCTIEGCDKRVKSRGLCNPHYLKWRKYGDPLLVKRAPKPPHCTIDDCRKPAYAREWCKAHYSQWKKKGDPRYRVRFPRPDACSVEGCERTPFSSQYCQAHYKRYRRWGDPLGSRNNQPEICEVEGCDRSAEGGARGWCNMHYERWRHHGDVSVVLKGGGGRKRAPRFTPATLTCLRCDRTLPSSSFAPYDKNTSGRLSRCRDCDNQRAAEYREANRELVNQNARISQFRRKHAKECSAIPFTLEQLQQRMAYYGNKCWICKVAPFEHVDHVKPLSKGGAHALCNLRPACATCNLRKRAKWPFKPEDILYAAVG